MATTMTVLYPDVDDATFDMDHRLAEHMPMVAERFGAHGMTGWQVVRPVGTPAGGRARFSVQATLEFGSAEGVEAVAAQGAEVSGDVPNSSNKGAEALIGEVMGHG